MADTYVLAAILEVEGNENAKAGVRDFVKALKIRPDAAIPKGMATSPVKAALKQAREQLGEAPKESATATAAKPESEKPDKAEKTDKIAQKEPDKQDKQKADEGAEANQEEATQQEAKQQAKQQKDKQARDDAEAKQQKEKQARSDAERDEKQQKESAKAKEAEGKDRADNERLRKEKSESDKQATDLKTRVKELEKDKADRDKQLADAKASTQQLEKDKADRDKQLADAKARAQQLEKDRADRDKQLADAKARIQQLEKDKADHDKQLAEARALEGKNREALEKLARDKEAEARSAEDKRHERERLFAGPEMPAHLREALTCAVPDEAPLRADLFVHCVARPNVKARSIVFYYRAGTAHYYSVPMERTAKGWYTAIVPGVRVTGKVLQYYAQALDDREVVAATNGKEASPNILMLRPGGPRG